MPIKVTCSNCGGVLHAPDDAGGKRGRCPTCGNILPIPAVAGGAAVPAAEPPRPARANPSFGDFALDKDKPAGAPARAEPARPVAEPRRQSVAIPAATDDDRPARRKPTSPFAKPGTAPAADGDATEGTVRAWRKARGGLWWVRTAAWLFLIPVLALNGLRLFEHFSGPLAFGGVLHADWLPPAQELDLALFGVPVVLGLLFLVFGRLSFSGVPRKTGARGLALFASLATLTAFGGLIAVLFPPLSALFTGVNPPAVDPSGHWQLFMMGDSLALIQRFGLTVGIAAFLVAEFWFVGALGRAASSLDNRRFGGRVTRFTLLMGTVAGLLLATGVVRPAFTENELPKGARPRGNAGQAGPIIGAPGAPGQPGKKENPPKRENPPAPEPVTAPTVEVAPTPAFDFNRSVKETAGEVHGVVRKEWVSLVQEAETAVAPDFAHWPAVRAGTFLLGGLLVGMMYLRMVGAGRRAIREWLDQHQPTT